MVLMEFSSVSVLSVVYVSPNISLAFDCIYSKMQVVHMMVLSNFAVISNYPR